MLHGFEQCTLSKLRLRLLVVDRRGSTATECLAEAGVVDTVADGAGLLYDGWFDFGHNVD